MRLDVLNLLVGLAATLFMTGVIWVIQVVHYPLFAQVGSAQFGLYHTGHNARITLVVLLPMLIEALTALVLVVARPTGVPLWTALLGLALVGVIWGSTFLLQVPYHNQLATLAGEESRAAIAGLVATNWLRTLAWTARSLLMLGVVATLL
ncbi:MAG: hypothetical protein H7Z42_09275 [Roseiflexaceae bacterium]|nr:hypothetical protein [Roseiflexaceae bacterium]